MANGGLVWCVWVANGWLVPAAPVFLCPAFEPVSATNAQPNAQPDAQPDAQRPLSPTSDPNANGNDYHLRHPGGPVRIARRGGSCLRLQKVTFGHFFDQNPFQLTTE